MPPPHPCLGSQKQSDLITVTVDAEGNVIAWIVIDDISTYFVKFSLLLLWSFEGGIFQNSSPISVWHRVPLSSSSSTNFWEFLDTIEYWYCRYLVVEAQKLSISLLKLLANSGVPRSVISQNANEPQGRIFWWRGRSLPSAVYSLKGSYRCHCPLWHIEMFF